MELFAKMKNILIINQSHTTNVGDKAIGIALEQWVSSHGWNPVTLPFWEERDVFGPLSYTKVSAGLKSISFTADTIVGNWVRKVQKKVLNSETCNRDIL